MEVFLCREQKGGDCRMIEYNQEVKAELAEWQKRMLRRPTLFSKLSKKLQTKVNNWIPEKVHAAITATIKQMIRAVLFGSKYTAARNTGAKNLAEIEAAVKAKIDVYRNTAAVEGGITGAGGILLGLVDFPVLLGIKIKLLFEIGLMYGFDMDDYKERVYLLHIFELAFSGDAHRKKIFLEMENWNEKKKNLPDSIDHFDWRTFQQEYRDYIDLAKMAQLIPVIGAPVGVLVNYRLLKKLGITAMNAYRMRYAEEGKLS